MTALGWMLVLPAASALLVTITPRARAVLWLCVAGSVASAAVTIVAALRAFGGPLFALGRQFFLDPLSAYHALIVVTVFVFSSVYAFCHFAPGIADGSFGVGKARSFGFLWFAFLGSMQLTLASNNVGLMWIGMEATTIASALLVALNRDRSAVRAAWTYLLMCSVAIALAFLGVVVACAEAQAAGGGEAVFLWTRLREIAPQLRAGPLQLAFVFALVGFGTKAGLAPMHSWLPDAHSQAPAPVSAVLSGVLLNCALYCLSRFLPVVEPSAPGWATGLLVPFGLLSIAVAAAFIVHEHDVKRLLAFSTVEHIGIITLGMGFGAPAVALFHTLNHSLSKMVAFFCAGTLAHRYGTREMSRIRAILRIAPVAGGGLLIALVALIGTPPWAVFMSELMIARAGIEGGWIAVVVVFILATAVIFIAAFRHVVAMTWEGPGKRPTTSRAHGIELGLVVIPLLFLFVIGIWMPPRLSEMLARAAAVIGGGG